jgi:predicted RecA/RadA family phage recombinase
MAETGLKLRTAAPSGDWRSFIVTAPSGGVTRGQMDLIHDTVGVYAQDADVGEDVAFIYHAEKIVVPKAAATSGPAFEAGDKVFFDHPNAEVKTTSGGYYLCGIAVKPAAALDIEVEIDLDGAAVTAV